MADDDLGVVSNLTRDADIHQDVRDGLCTPRMPRLRVEYKLRTGSGWARQKGCVQIFREPTMFGSAVKSTVIKVRE